MDEKSLKDGHSSASAILLCQKTVKYFLGEILNYLDVNSYLTLSTPFFCIAVKIREDQLKVLLQIPCLLLPSHSIGLLPFLGRNLEGFDTTMILRLHFKALLPNCFLSYCSLHAYTLPA